MASHLDPLEWEDDARESPHLAAPVLAAWVLGHMAAGVFVAVSSLPALVHQALALGAVCLWSVSARAIRWDVAGAAYLAFCDVLWRMVGGGMFWEGGKYAAALALCLHIARRKSFDVAFAPLAYAVVVVASAMMAGMTDVVEVPSWRKSVSFALSGPALMCLFVLALGACRLELRHVATLLAAVLGPVAMVSGIVLHATVTASEVTFNMESNFVTSGGFGPNQVSSVLSAGALVCLCLVRSFALTVGARVLTTLLLLLWLGQSVLTFSRSGIYMFGCAAIVCLASPGAMTVLKRRALAIVACVLALGILLALPKLSDYTGGKLEERYRDASLAGREVLAAADLNLWKQRPVFGVGAGLSPYMRAEQFGIEASHTEYIRVLAETGIVGMILFLALLTRTGWRAWRLGDTDLRASFLAMVSWSILFFAVNGFRIGAPAVFLGFACLRLADEGDGAAEADGLEDGLIEGAGPGDGPLEIGLLSQSLGWTKGRGGGVASA